jgi:Histidine kinase
MLMKKIIIFLIVMNCLVQQAAAQKRIVDSMIGWIESHHIIDSQYILTLHRISYRSIDLDLKQAFAYYEKVSYYSDSLHSIYGKALAQINLGILFSKSANFDASNQAYFKAIEYADSCGAMRLTSVSLNNVGDNFKVLKDDIKCRQYTMEAIPINTKLKMWRGVAINYELLQRCDIDEKLYDSAKNNIDRGMKYAVISNDTSLILLFYLGYGKLHAVNSRKDSALFYFNKVIQEAKLSGDPVAEYEACIAKVQYLQDIKPDEKMMLLKKALQLARQTADLERLSETAHQLYLAYDEKNNKDSSLAYFRIYHNSADSLFSSNNKRNVAIKETEWMVKRKEIENLHLKEVTQLQNKELGVKNILLMAIGISLLLIIIIAAILNKSAQSNKRTAEFHLRQNIAETQMQVLRSQMNPHFIFNSLNSIDAFIQSNDKYNATMYLNKFAKLIRNVLDSSKQDTITFSKDIETLKLYMELELQRSENKFTTALNIDPELMNSDYKVPPLIIQPFVENAIIHGLRNRTDNHGLLTVDIEKTENKIIYTITDNGIGRRAAEQMKNGKTTSYGLEMSYERVKLFNKEGLPSVQIDDLYNNNKAAGTSVQVQLNII